MHVVIPKRYMALGGIDQLRAALPKYQSITGSMAIL
jgi:hypothetical protein